MRWVRLDRNAPIKEGDKAFWIVTPEELDKLDHITYDQGFDSDDVEFNTVKGSLAAMVGRTIAYIEDNTPSLDPPLVGPYLIVWRQEDNSTEEHAEMLRFFGTPAGSWHGYSRTR